MYIFDYLFHSLQANQVTFFLLSILKYSVFFWAFQVNVTHEVKQENKEDTNAHVQFLQRIQKMRRDREETASI